MLNRRRIAILRNNQSSSLATAVPIRTELNVLFMSHFASFAQISYEALKVNLLPVVCYGALTLIELSEKRLLQSLTLSTLVLQAIYCIQ